MSSITETLPSSFIVFGAVLVLTFVLTLVVTLVALRVLLRARKANNSLKNEMLKFDRRLSIASAGAIGMGQRIIALEHKLQSLNDVAMHAADSDRAAYTQAMQLFDRGADINTVMDSCSISSSEASLMELMRQKALTKSREVAQA